MQTDHIKNRNMLVQVVLFIITLGLYGVYWFYSTLNELQTANGKDSNAGLWTVIALIPIGNFFAWWHYGSEVGAFTNDKYPVIAVFFMWLIVSPLVWLLVQIELNRASRGEELRTTFQNLH